MKIEILRHYTIRLSSESPVALWFWGFKKYGHEITVRRSLRGKHGVTIRIGTSLVVVTLPGKGYLR